MEREVSEVPKMYICDNGSCGDCVSADVTADAYIEDIKYCPFCGEEL